MRRIYAVRRSRAADWAKRCGGVALPVLVLAALGTRVGLVPPQAMLVAAVVGFLLGLLAFGIAIYALIDIWESGAEGALSATAAIVYALPVLALLGLIATAAVMYPRLTDISTDLDDPPAFVSAEAPRGAHFSLEDMQEQDVAYPDLVTHDYPLPLGQVYAAVRKQIAGRGWAITRDTRPEVMPLGAPDADSPVVGETDEVTRALAAKSVMTQSRGGAATQTLPTGTTVQRSGPVGEAVLEATAKTPVFGFHDSVVVRLRGSADGTQLDMRSASNLGAHDLGQNARRIRSFLKSLDETLQPPSGTGVASASQ